MIVKVRVNRVDRDSKNKIVFIEGYIERVVSIVLGFYHKHTKYSRVLNDYGSDVRKELKNEQESYEKLLEWSDFRDMNDSNLPIGQISDKFEIYDKLSAPHLILEMDKIEVGNTLHAVVLKQSKSSNKFNLSLRNSIINGYS